MSEEKSSDEISTLNNELSSIKPLKEQQSIEKRELMKDKDAENEENLEKETKYSEATESTTEEQLNENTKKETIEEKVAEENHSISKFLNWLEVNNSHLYGLTLAEFGTDEEHTWRGILSTKKVPKDHVVVSIDKDLILTNNTHSGDEWWNILTENHAKFSVPKIIILVVTLAIEFDKGEESAFKPYLDVLPTDLSNFPIFWSKEELKYLEGSHILRELEIRKQNLFRDYEMLKTILPEIMTSINYERFQRLRTIVGSRNFSIKVNGEPLTALVPFADMLNHGVPRQTSWEFNDEAKAFMMTSTEEIKAHQEVVDSYGLKSNSKLLLHYGFALESNCRNNGSSLNDFWMSVQIPSNLDEKDSMVSLQMLGTSVKRVCLTADVQHCKGFNTIMSFCRVCVATNEERDYLRKYSGGNVFDFEEFPLAPISRSNELKAFSMFCGALGERFCQYPTTADDDNKLLLREDLPESSPERFAAMVVKGEKEIAETYVNLAAHASILLQTRNYEDTWKLIGQWRESKSLPDNCIDALRALLMEIAYLHWDNP
eukprot:TRINITY_DN1493_c1_g2_i1.p1 TRINITY_DN1493_c1_g2~~TRINITY_DN1493_c1_g2_i1.p1  ORF type:complete len:544 (-),score=144.53 TRINITY_DN1493_c1_g2_i1:654-2285(-)